MNKEKYNKCTDEIKQMVEKYANNIPYIIGVAYQYLEQRNYEKAEKTLEMARCFSTERIEIYCLLSALIDKLFSSKNLKSESIYQKLFQNNLGDIFEIMFIFLEKIFIFLLLSLDGKLIKLIKDLRKELFCERKLDLHKIEGRINLSYNCSYSIFLEEVDTLIQFQVLASKEMSQGEKPSLPQIEVWNEMQSGVQFNLTNSVTAKNPLLYSHSEGTFENNDIIPNNSSQNIESSYQFSNLSPNGSNIEVSAYLSTSTSN